MRKNYDFSKSVSNPHVKKTKKQLGRMVRALRGSAAKLGTPTPAEIEKLVSEVRKTRAGRN